MSGSIEKEFDPGTGRKSATRRRVPRQTEGEASQVGYQPPLASVEGVRRLEAVGYSEDAMDLITGLASRFMETDLAARYLREKDQRTATAMLLRESGVMGRGLNVAMRYLKDCARDGVHPR